MRPREDMARFIEKQLSADYELPDYLAKGAQGHYGIQELRALMDFLYDEQPRTEAQKIKRWRLFKDPWTGEPLP